MTQQLTRDSAQTPTLRPSARPKLFEILWQRKMLVALGVCGALLVGALKFINEQPLYSASAQLMVLKRKWEPTSQLGGGSSVQVGVIEDYVATQEALIQSHEVLSRAAKRLEAGGELRSPPASGDFIALIAMGLKVVRLRDGAGGGNSNILNISYQGLSSADCPIVVNAVIEGYREALSGAVSTVTKESIKQIEKERADTEKRLEEKLSEYEKLHEKMAQQSQLTTTDLRARINVNEGKRTDLAERKIELDNCLQIIQEGIENGENRELLLSIIERRFPSQSAASAGGGAPSLANSTHALQDELLKLKIQESELIPRLGAGHADIVSLRKRREVLTEALRGQTLTRDQKPADQKPVGDGLDVYMQVVAQELAVIKLKFNGLQHALDEDRLAVQKLDGSTIRESALGQDCDRLRKHLVYYDERKHQADLMQDAPLFDARVITPAGMGSKVSPVLVSTLALFGSVGFFLGAMLAYLAEVTDKRFRSVQDVGQRLGLTVIGDVPMLTAHEPSTIVEHPIDPMLVVHHLPKSREAEAFRGIRTSIYFSTHGKGHQVIQVTSPTPGDGKSTMAANLAASIAQSGKRVILIDADFRKPRIHKIFGLSADVGLASVITGETQLQAAIQHCEVPGLAILPCGPRPANPADLLSSALFEDVLDEIKKNYDFVLIDTPPLLVVSDPSVVAPRADGVILAVRMSQNDRPAAVQATERLNILGAKILGVVVNGTLDQRSGYGYGYAYRYSYKYQYRYEAYGDDGETPLLGTSKIGTSKNGKSLGGHS